MNSWGFSIFVFFLAAGYSKLPVIYLHRICDVDDGELNLPKCVMLMIGALNLPKMCDVELDLVPLNSRQGPGGGGGVGSGGGGPPGG